jgi:TrmH family RNA methyltransferase
MKIDDIRRLHQKKYRDEFGCFLVEGEHLVLELQKAAARNSLLRGCELYVTNQHEHWQSPFRTHVISDRQMAQIAETKSPQGILAVAPILPTPAATSIREGERAIYLYEVQDPGNLGTILRTLAWFGNFRCLLSPGSVDPHNSKVVRASMGAIFHVPVELDVKLDALSTRFERIACLDMSGESIASSTFKTFDCYLFGNEARGVPREKLALLNAEQFTIGGGDAIDSLNLAAAVQMCTYELNRLPG